MENLSQRLVEVLANAVLALADGGGPFWDHSNNQGDGQTPQPQQQQPPASPANQ